MQSTWVPFLVVFGSTTSYFLCYVAVIFCLHRSNKLVYNRYYTFDVLIILIQTHRVDSEVARFNKAKLSFEKFSLTNRISYMIADKFDPQENNVSDVGSLLGSISTKLTKNSNQKRRITESVVYRRRKQIPRILEPSLMRLILTISIYFVASTIMSYIRYSVVTNKNKSSAYLYTAAKNKVDFYIQTYSINFAMVEKYMFEDVQTIDFISVDEFYKKKRSLIGNRVISTMDELHDSDMGEVSTSYRGWMDTNMEDVLASFNNGERYANDTIAMAGMVDQNSVISFVKRYKNLCDQFMSDWVISNDKQQRINLLEYQLYNSQLAFSIYNFLGTVDTIYYHVIYPLWTLLTYQLSKLPSFILVVDIVSYGFSIILFFYDLVYISSRMIREFGGRNNLILIVPIRLMIGEYFWKKKIRRARELGYFDYS